MFILIVLLQVEKHYGLAYLLQLLLIPKSQSDATVQSATLTFYRKNAPVLLGSQIIDDVDGIITNAAAGTYAYVDTQNIANWANSYELETYFLTGQVDLNGIAQVYNAQEDISAFFSAKLTNTVASEAYAYIYCPTITIQYSADSAGLKLSTEMFTVLIFTILVLLKD